MTSLPKIAVIGHSFIKRLARDIRDRSITDLKQNLNLSQCDIKFCWSGGWEVLDFVRFDNVIAPFLRSYRPNVVVLQVGGNDVNTSGQTVQTISIAGALDELAMRLLNTFGVSSVYIGEIFTRKRLTNISPENYATRRTETMRYLTTMVQHEPRIRLWFHRRIFG